MWREPTIAITREGQDLCEVYADAVLRVRIELSRQSKSDRLTLDVADPNRTQPVPRKGDVFSAFGGWVDQRTDFGKFEVQRVSHRGDAKGVETLTIVMRAAQLVDGLRRTGRRDWPAGTTAARVFEDLGSLARIEFRVHPALRDIVLDYEMLMDQSILDFATDLAGRIGAIARPGGGLVSIVPPFDGQAVSGAALDRVAILKTKGHAHEADLEGREVYGRIVASYTDPASGQRRSVTEGTGVEGPPLTLDQTWPSEAAARRSARQRALDQRNATASRRFTQPGMPTARPGAPVTIRGYGDLIDGEGVLEGHQLEWSRATGFTSTLDVGGGKEGAYVDGQGRPGRASRR